MLFEWDDTKNKTNIAKHGISFEMAKLIFSGPTLDLVDERFDYREIRVISLGSLKGVVVLSVTHTDRDGRIRIISARAASRKERAIYNAEIHKTSKR